MTDLSFCSHDSSTGSTFAVEDVSVVSAKRALHQKEVECDSLKETITALTAALHEMNLELREKTVECDALQETVMTLSRTLQDSDRQLQESLVQGEQLDLKLQAVTFVDVKDHLNGEEKSPRGKGKAKKQKKKKADKKKGSASKAKRSKNKQSSRQLNGLLGEECDGGDTDEDEESSVGSHEVRTELRDVDIEAGERHPVGQRIRVAAPPQMPSHSSAESEVGDSAPCQAAFYRVIHERDQAKNQADKLGQEVKHRREQVRKLRGKLNKAQGLIELSYQEEDDGEVSPPETSITAQSGNAPSPMKWLMKGQKVKTAKLAANEMAAESARERTTCSTPPLRPKNHSRSSRDSKYLNAIHNDADKAAGSLRSSSERFERKLVEL